MTFTAGDKEKAKRAVIVRQSQLKQAKSGDNLDNRVPGRLKWCRWGEVNRKDMDKAVQELFTDGSGIEYDRLVLEPHGEHYNASGWCKMAVVDLLCRELGIGDKD